MNQVGFSLVPAPRRWDVLAGFMEAQGYKTFVEVGCKEGRTTGHILRTIPDARVIAIDPWMKQEPSQDRTRETYADWDFEQIEREFWQNVGGNADRCTMKRATSAEVAAEYRGSADLVFIDALHDNE